MSNLNLGQSQMNPSSSAATVNNQWPNQAFTTPNQSWPNQTATNNTTANNNFNFNVNMATSAPNPQNNTMSFNLWQ